MKLRPLCCGQPRRRPRKSFAAQNNGAATAVMSGITDMVVVAPGVAAAMVVAVVTVGVATPTTVGRSFGGGRGGRRDGARGRSTG